MNLSLINFFIDHGFEYIFFFTDLSPWRMGRLVWSKQQPVSSYTSSSWLKTVSCPHISLVSESSGILRLSTTLRTAMAKNGLVNSLFLHKLNQGRRRSRKTWKLGKGWRILLPEKVRDFEKKTCRNQRILTMKFCCVALSKGRFATIWHSL